MPGWSQLAQRVRLRPAVSRLGARLRGDRTPGRGYLEVWDPRVDQWKLACDPDPEGSFGLTQATVACRQLGYRMGGSRDPNINEGPRPSLPALPVIMKCKGDETAVDQCTWKTTEEFTVDSGR